MEVAQLRSVVAIWQERSFTKAAEQLSLSQSALSQQIKALERDLGTTLFERRGRRLTITQSGELVLAYATQMVHQAADLMAALAALQGGITGRIRIGTSDTICLYVLPPVVQAFRQAYPAVEIHLTNRPSAEVVALLCAGAIDFGIVTLPVQEAGVESEFLLERREVAICPPDHPLAAQSTVTLSALAQHPLLLLERGTTSRALFDLLVTQANVTPQVIELGSIEVLKRYAEIGLGVALVPAMAITEERKARRLHALHLPWMPARAIGIIRRRRSDRGAVEVAFLRLLMEQITLFSNDHFT